MGLFKEEPKPPEMPKKGPGPSGGSDVYRPLERTRVYDVLNIDGNEAWVIEYDPEDIRRGWSVYISGVSVGTASEVADARNKALNNGN